MKTGPEKRRRWMLKDQRDLLAVFNAHGVKYLVIGAHAVGINPPSWH